MKKQNTLRSTGKKILHFPLTKIILGLVVVLLITTLVQRVIEKLTLYFPLDTHYRNLIITLLVSVISLSIYAFLFRYYEKRKIKELSLRKLLRYTLWGLLLGLGLQSASIGVMVILGSYTIESVNSFNALIPAFNMALGAAVIEEIIFRGILYRILEEKLGSYISVVISAVLFGFLHLVNPNSSILAAIAIAIQAGLLLAAAYTYTRNLWFPIAIHFAWNFAQSGIYGASTSGIQIRHSLFTSHIEGNPLFTGGAFGPEASLQATIFGLAAGLILLWLSKKQNNIIAPFWIKNK